MKKIIASVVIIAAFVFYSIIRSKIISNAPQVLKISNNPQRKNLHPTNTLKNNHGVSIGSVANAFYGNVQVEATIRNGKLIAIQFLQYPKDLIASSEINQQADPLLVQEAIRSQSAHVDTVSGATDTSEAFMQSLTSALKHTSL